HSALAIEKGMIAAVANLSRADRLPPVVDTPRLAQVAAERAQVLHLPIAGEEGVTPVVAGEGDADDLTDGIDGQGFAAFAAQRAQVGDMILVEAAGARIEMRVPKPT